MMPVSLLYTPLYIAWNEKFLFKNEVLMKKVRAKNAKCEEVIKQQLVVSSSAAQKKKNHNYSKKQLIRQQRLWHPMVSITIVVVNHLN